MKTQTTTILLLLLSTVGVAQNCSKFYPLNEGTTFQITNFEKNDKPSTTIDYSIKNSKNVSGIQTATINSIIKDKKGKLIAESDFEMNCSGDVTSIDFKSLMNAQMFTQFKDMETEISGHNLELPNNLTVGQQLPDASVDIKISISGINMSMTSHIKDRTVVSRESVTTPAGTFDCYVISYTSEFNSMGMNQSSSAKQWIAEGVGMVKQEDYNNNGAVRSKSLLTDFSK
jgi:hypothetical protein